MRTVAGILAAAVAAMTACGSMNDESGAWQGEQVLAAQDLNGNDSPKTTAAAAAAASSDVMITFDDAISGATSYPFDADGDGMPDAMFRTDDPSGFNTVGPGPNMTYINEPGLEGSSNLPASLKIEFLVGATKALRFGFAVSEQTQDFGCTFKVFDQAGNLLASTFTQAQFTTLPNGQRSSFPEGLATATFAGVGKYATISFTNTSRYIIDNFAGTFGTTQRIERFSTEGFLPPVGNARRLGSTLPLKLNLFFDGQPITSQQQLDAALTEVGFPAGCARLAVFAQNDPTDLAAGGGFENAGPPGSGNGCFRFSDEGSLIFNLKIGPETFARGMTYEAGVRLDSELLSPENRLFQVR
jgi:hypothetical protein